MIAEEVVVPGLGRVVEMGEGIDTGGEEVKKSSKPWPLGHVSGLEPRCHLPNRPACGATGSESDSMISEAGTPSTSRPESTFLIVDMPMGRGGLPARQKR